MSIQGKIHRLFIIVDKISENQKRDHYLSKREIHEILEAYDLETSARTLTRDFETLKVEFGISIEYCNKRRGYFINHKDSLKVHDILNFFELVSVADVITTNLKENKDLLKSISFDNRGNLLRIENLKILFLSIKNSKLITFVHLNYNKGTKTKYKIKPYLLKEYLNRWYVIGEVFNTKDIRIFGIDRILDLKIMKENFIPNPNIGIKEKFADIIGLVYGGKVEKVEIKFTPKQGRYVKSLPWHKSQKILIDNNQELRIELTIFPNEELIQKVLRLGSRATVLKPGWLAKRIYQELQDAIRNY